MLIRFVLSNFLSFDEESDFNMLAGSLKTHKHHVYNAGKVDVLKASAIYGANGAGKSNLIKAMEFLQNTVKVGGLVTSINDKKFRLNKDNLAKPIVFEIEFSIENKIYAYGVNFNNNHVVEEWLYESGITIEDKLIFERKKMPDTTKINLADKYKKTQKQRLLIELMEENLLKDNELFLGKTDNLKMDELTKVRSWLENNLVIIHPKSKFTNLLSFIAESDKFKTFANELLQTFDTGAAELAIETIDFEHFFGEEADELKKELINDLDSGETILFYTHSGSVLILKEQKKYVVKRLMALHKDKEGTSIPFDLEDESDGTQRLLDFIPAFSGILEEEITFVIDEIDQSLHPALLHALIHKLMADDTTKGQFIFSTHESNLLDLDLFRQDEIWFIEKNKQTGSSSLYSLSEFKARYDLDIRKGYLKGRFGAMPFLTNLENLNWAYA